MSLSIGITKSEKIVIVDNGRSICEVEKMKGFDLLRMHILDTAVNSLSDELRKKGLVMSDPLPKVEPTPVMQKTNKSPIIYFIDVLTVWLFMFTWIAGITVADAESKWKAALMFPYSWYLLTESVLIHSGLIK